MKRFVKSFVLAMLIILGGISVCFAGDATNMIPRNPVWSELCANDQYKCYLLNNPISKHTSDGTKIAVVKYLCRKPYKVDKKTCPAGSYMYRVLMFNDNDTEAMLVAMDMYDKSGKCLCSMNTDFMLKEAKQGRALIHRVQEGEVEWFIINEQHY